MDKKNKSVFTYRIEDAITPLDGRNKYKLKKFIQYWSELILNKNRVLVEIAYLQELSKYQVIRNFTKEELAVINRLHKLFNRDDYQKIREIEAYFFDLGCDGDSGGGDENSEIVYAYKKNEGTNP